MVWKALSPFCLGSTMNKILKNDFSQPKAQLRYPIITAVKHLQDTPERGFCERFTRPAAVSRLQHEEKPSITPMYRKEKVRWLSPGGFRYSACSEELQAIKICPSPCCCCFHCRKGKGLRTAALAKAADPCRGWAVGGLQGSKGAAGPTSAMDASPAGPIFSGRGSQPFPSTHSLPKSLKGRLKQWSPRSCCALWFLVPM